MGISNQTIAFLDKSIDLSGDVHRKSILRVSGGPATFDIVTNFGTNMHVVAHYNCFENIHRLASRKYKL